MSNHMPVGIKSFLLTAERSLNPYLCRPTGVFPKCFPEFTEYSVTKIFVITAKGLELAISCVRDQHATTAPARHMLETWSLNWLQFMLQRFIRFFEFAEFTESLAHLGKTPLTTQNLTQLRFDVSWPRLSCTLIKKYPFKKFITNLEGNQW